MPVMPSPVSEKGASLFGCRDFVAQEAVTLLRVSKIQDGADGENGDRHNRSDHHQVPAPLAHRIAQAALANEAARFLRLCFTLFGGCARLGPFARKARF